MRLPGTLLVGTWFWCCSCAPVNDADPRILKGTFTIDRELSEEQREHTLLAIDMWRVGTQGRFDPVVKIAEVSCGQRFALEAVTGLGCHVGQVVHSAADGQDRVLGAVSRSDHTVAVVSWLEGDDFTNNVAHELGHYLLLGHADGIMAQKRNGQVPVVSELSVMEFCSIWSCPAGPAD